ncbi:MAG: AMP-binding protein [Ahrensia sp.]|nr:AMP-binding protein [Ahrensia sp.]
MFASSVCAHGERTAVTDGTRSVAYTELDRRSSALACSLDAQGVSVGDRIGVLAHNCLEYVEIELAAAKLGAIVAALNWRLGPRELTHCIALAAPKVMIVQPHLTALLGQCDVDLTNVVTVGHAYEALMSNGAESRTLSELDPEAGLMILYTSGTTGLPKGALISHRALVARAAAFYAELRLPHDCDFIAWAPFFHMASTDHALATLMRGGTVHVVDGYQADRICDLVERNTIGWLVLMPGMIEDFAEHCRKRCVSPKGISVCGAMADLVPREHIAAITSVLNTPYLNSFGSTETGLPPATGLILPQDGAPTDLRKRQSCYCELRLVDPQDNDIPIGTPGEAALRGPTLFSGYWQANETNEREFRGGWFHMGDVLRRNDDGTLDYVDRVKYLIKSGGENIYPVEIEQVVLADNRVEEAICVRRPDAKWGEVPVLFVVKRDESLSAGDLTRLCEGNLSRYKRPKQVHFLEADELPRSTTGKIQRHRLEERLVQQG